MNKKNSSRFFLAIAACAPLFIMGIVSSVVYVRMKTQSEEKSLFYNSQMLINDVDYSLSYIREHYTSLFFSFSCRWMDSENVPPYNKIDRILTAQRFLADEPNPNSAIKLYYYINIKHKWMLSGRGIFPFDVITNIEDFESALSAIGKGKSLISWIDLSNDKNINTETAGYYDVHLNGKFLCLMRRNASGAAESVLLVQINDFLFVDMLKAAKSLYYNVSVTSGDMCVMTEGDNIIPYAVRGKKGDVISNTIYSTSSGIKYAVWKDVHGIQKEGDVFLFASLFIMAGICAAALLSYFIHRYIIVAQSERDRISFFKSLICFSPSDDDIKTGIEKWNIPCNAFYVFVMFYIIEDNIIKDNSKTNFYDVGAINFSALLCPIIKINNKFGTIIYSADRNEMDILIKQSFELLKKHFGNIHMGCSKVFCDLCKCKTARNEASEPFLYGAQNKDEISSLYLFDDYLHTGYSRSAVDDTLECDLEDAVCRGDMVECERIIGMILSRMEIRSLAGVDRAYYVSKIVTIVFSAIVKCRLTVGDVFDTEAYNKITSRDSLVSGKHDLKSFFAKDVIAPAVQKIQFEQNSHDSDMVKRIYALISDKRGNITLSECADMIGRHPNTITKVLRSEKDTSFTDLVNGVKLRQAKYYLLTSNMSVNDIARHLGYANVQNFGRFFKERTGFAPLKYRDMNYALCVKP